MMTIPVSLVGTFALMKLLGFSINTLTLFGITLATGLVVDDAIVVIENIARFVREKRMAPYPPPLPRCVRFPGGRRYVARSARGFHPGCVLPRLYRATLQAIRGHDRLLDHDLALHRAYACSAVGGAVARRCREGHREDASLR